MINSEYHSYSEDSVSLDPASPFYQDHISRYWWAAKKFAKNQNVLDCACGHGYGTYILSHAAGYSLGVDLNKDSLEIANSVFVANNLEYKEYDIRTLENLTKRKFDLITVFEVIEHIPNSESDVFINSIKKVLDTNGKVLISTPNHDVVLKSGVKIPHFHINNYRPAELRRQLESHFHNVTMIGQFKKRSFYEQLFFTLDVLNLRHAIKRHFAKTTEHSVESRVSNISNYQPNTKRDIMNPDFVREPEFYYDYYFSKYHWRQAGLTLAVCSDPKW